MATTKTSRVIKASPETLYAACTDPDALATWLAPGEMIVKVHSFELKVGEGYSMSLLYPPSGEKNPGKTSSNEDKFFARFIVLDPPKKIIEAITFDSTDPAFSGEMIMEITFEAVTYGTKVTFFFKNIPHGIRPEDNEAGTLSSLEKLARYVE